MGASLLMAGFKESVVPRFDEYLLEVQERNGLQPIDLIRAWAPDEILTVEAALRASIAASNIVNSTIPNLSGISNQSKGNKAADYFMDVISQNLVAPNSVIQAQGAGYPDKIFLMGTVGFCMELKATSKWKNGDSNRRVLTSAPDKMRHLVSSGQVDNPPAHLICTVLYSEQNSTVDGIRLDFLEPSSEVNIRLEASTSQRLLNQGPHHKVNIN
jgi:hypothetical protein